jgi:monofunctional glycosyltransferase
MTQFREPSSREPGPDDPPTIEGRAVWTAAPTPRTEATARTAAPTTLTQVPPATGVPHLPDVFAAAPVRRRWITVRGLVRTLALVVVLAIIATLGQVLAYRWITPPTSTLMLAQQVTGTTISRDWRPLDRISPNLARAVIMSEDAGFCGHRGVDWKELARVYEQSLDGGSTGGGSTLSMQVTKNLFLWPSKSYVRKAIEVPLTLLADRWWGKPRMLEIYLNVAEWGPGIFGAEAAARAYFKKSAAQLSETEAALLAVALPNPLQRNAANPSPLQRRLAANVQARMRTGTSNARCLVRVTS